MRVLTPTYREYTKEKCPFTFQCYWCLNFTKLYCFQMGNVISGNGNCEHCDRQFCTSLVLLSVGNRRTNSTGMGPS